jgi:hypothetical protein
MDQGLDKWGFLSGLFSGFGKERVRRKARDQMLLLPCPPHVHGKKKTYGAVQNNTVFTSLFFFSDNA